MDQRRKGIHDEEKEGGGRILRYKNGILGNHVKRLLKQKETLKKITCFRSLGIKATTLGEDSLILDRDS